MDRSMALRRDLADALTIILDASRGRNVCPARFFCRPPRAASNSPAIGRLRPPFVSSPLQASDANGLIADRIATRNFHYPKKWDRCHQQTSPHRARPRRTESRTPVDEPRFACRRPGEVESSPRWTMANPGPFAEEPSRSRLPWPERTRRVRVEGSRRSSFRPDDGNHTT